MCLRFKTSLIRYLEFFWYPTRKNTLPLRIWCTILWPFSALYKGLLHGRQAIKVYQAKRLTSLDLKQAYLLVVGNVTLGGTGKTPCVMQLARHFSSQGWVVGIVSRGYGRKTKDTRLVSDVESPASVGDEPYLLYQRTQVCVVVGKTRVHGIQHLLKVQPKTQLILCDDGLQDNGFQADCRLVLLDGKRGLGNAKVLPTGPLRTPLSPVFSSSWNGLIVNQRQSSASPPCHLHPALKKLALPCYNLFYQNTGFIKAIPQSVKATFQQKPQLAQAFVQKNQGRAFLAVSGIAYPQAFFDTLRELGLTIESRVYPDHHAFSRSDCLNWKGYPVIMTEKDAVKCLEYIETEEVWVLSIEAVLEKALLTKIERSLQEHG